MSSTTTLWVAFAITAVITFGIKAAGPVMVGGRPLPGPVAGVVALMAPALLAALVVVQTFSDDDALVLDARAAGLGAAFLAILARLPLVAVVVLAAAVTAGVRALT